MKNNLKKYVSAMIKVETYKKLKGLALELGMPLTRLIDVLYDHYMKGKGG
jgi:hypothetical protein